MSGKTGIAWTDVSWNPVSGCTRVSKGCNHCYAFQLHDQRHVAWKRGRWDTAPAQYHQPFSRVQLLEDRLADPLHWRKPKRVFVSSMSDLFHPDVPDSFILDCFYTMVEAPQHTYQILTKRPERMRDFMLRYGDTCTPIWYHLPHIWLGVSVEDQAAADERIPLLLQTPAEVRFLSCEPLLGPVDVRRGLIAPGLDWVIIGGESGPHARPMELEWTRSLKDQCEAAGVPVFVKQLGTVLAKRFNMRNRHGGDIEEWRERHLLPTLDVREWPTCETAATK